MDLERDASLRSGSGFTFGAHESMAFLWVLYMRTCEYIASLAMGLLAMDCKLPVGSYL